MIEYYVTNSWLKFFYYILKDGCYLQTGYVSNSGCQKTLLDERTESGDQCYQLVRDNKKWCNGKLTRANGLTWHSWNGECFAEFFATRISDRCMRCQSCIF